MVKCSVRNETWQGLGTRALQENSGTLDGFSPPSGSPVLEVNIADGDDDRVPLVPPVEADLLQPVKVCGVLDLWGGQEQVTRQAIMGGWRKLWGGLWTAMGRVQSPL